jgi:hypothetical protein
MAQMDLSFPLRRERPGREKDGNAGVFLTLTYKLGYLLREMLLYDSPGWLLVLFSA